MSNIKGQIYFQEKFGYTLEEDKNSITYSKGRISIHGNGLTETFLYHISESSSWSWIVCGIGIIDSSRFIQHSEWQNIINQEEIKLDQLDGHWIIFRWQANKFEFYNDPFELRKLYLKQEHDRVVFSTQLVDLIDMIDDPEFSFQNYSGFVIYKNSFGNESILKNVKRLGVNGVLKINDENVFHKFTHWDIERDLDKPFCLEKFKSIANIKFSNRKKPVLLLSGGMDSRTVLAMQEELPELLTLGDRNNIDAKIAKMIGNKLNQHVHYGEYKLPLTHDEKIHKFELIRDSVLKECHGFFNYINILEEMNKKEFWAIDGGRGEVIRHGSTRSILFFGKKYIQKNDIISLSKLLCTKLYPCFENHLEDKMIKWAEIEFKEAIESMPKGLNIYEWITLLQIRYRVKNTAMNIQAAHDSIIPTYMPLIQPSVVRSLESYPYQKRINNRLNSMIINKYMPILTTLPIERFNTKSPYFFRNSVVLSKAYSVIYHRFIKEKQSYNDLLMLSLKEIVLERLNSSKVRNCGWYDTKRVIELADLFYNGHFKDSKFLYNWLQIDFWRERLNM